MLPIPVTVPNNLKDMIKDSLHCLTNAATQAFELLLLTNDEQRLPVLKNAAPMSKTLRTRNTLQ